MKAGASTMRFKAPVLATVAAALVPQIAHFVKGESLIDKVLGVSSFRAQADKHRALAQEADCLSCRNWHKKNFRRRPV